MILAPYLMHHWSLDVALQEDACRIHRGQAAEIEESGAGGDVPCKGSRSIVFHAFSLG